MDKCCVCGKEFNDDLDRHYCDCGGAIVSVDSGDLYEFLTEYDSDGF